MSVPLIAVVGNVNVDLVLGPQAAWPEPGTESLVARAEFRVGGSAGNSALALRALGAPVRLVGGLGNDAFGGWLRAELQDVPADWIATAAPTSVSVGIAHPTGERSFFSHLGHLGAIDLRCLEPALDALPDGSVALLVGAYLMPALARDYPRLMRRLRGRGCQVALDAGWPPAGWTAGERARTLGWLETCDHLLVNDAEAAGLTGERDPDDAAAALRSRLSDGATLVIKRGPRGAAGWRGAWRASAPAPPVEVVDTVGAGDTFNAAYLLAHARGDDLETALAAGVRAASHAISTFPRRYAPDPIPPEPAARPGRTAGGE